MIQLNDIHKQFGSTHVLRGVSLHVKRGEVCVLLGPSGGGKSTLLRTINGLESFTQGTIRVGNLILTPDAHDPKTVAAIRRQVGFVFQQFHLFPHLTVLQNVTEAPQRVLHISRAQAENEAQALLARVGLSDKLHVRPTTLSGGQQQRVAIVRALAMKPDAILFDEPTSSLDPQMTAEVTSVIGDLTDLGQTMVIVTHAMTFARRVANTVHVMHAGKIAESGSPAAIFENPQHETTRSFLAATREA